MVQRRTAISIAVGALCVACAAGALTSTPAEPTTVEVEALPEGEASLVVGSVVSHEDGKPSANAIVVLQCECLQGPRETQTNADGLFAFRDLPPGEYTAQALLGAGEASRRFEVRRASKVMVKFSVSTEAQVVT